MAGDKYRHLIEIDEEERSLTIYRVKGSEHEVYTSVKVPEIKCMDDPKAIDDFCRILGENILLDTPIGRKLFGIEEMKLNLNTVGTVIATREFHTPDGKTVTVFIGKPESFPDGNDYYCPYQITGIKRDRVRYAAGIDAVQALGLVFRMIGADLYTSDEARAGTLIWEAGENGDLGFPKPE